MIHFLVHSATDTVGVAVTEGVKRGQTLTGRVMDKGETITIAALDDIPLGHKIAVADIEDKGTVVKYGHDIGRTVAPIRRGEHVHVHNLRTKRW
ncbi:MAG: flagellar biosynthesis protein FlgA [Betaproteobacteria bacterium]|nr:flagellar biosynthesis protein FlgA [Betaproteobacteria bacterium]